MTSTEYAIYFTYISGQMTKSEALLLLKALGTDMSKLYIQRLRGY